MAIPVLLLLLLLLSEVGNSYFISNVASAPAIF